ncbi:recombinase family protein, partial [Faecalibaculum rodentium]|uniref:recombinase family protein n=1 Tax=Faecalibaculum rodentium TaxID=1702221 RepID=UPI0023F3DEB8
MDTRKKAVMQDFLAGELSCDEYEEIKTCCVRESERLKERILTLRGEQNCQSETLTVDNPWLKTFSGLQLPDRLDRNLACALIQRNLLDEYIRSHPEFSGCEVLEFLDDGRSGTNMNRPGMCTLLEAAKQRRIDCVIVKDLSRFARDYLTSGYYLEQVFPALGIRFISINDGYDSNDFPYGTAGNISNGLLSLINEMYSRDLSQKAKAAKRLYAQKGQCISAYPIYGYLKSPEDKRTWIPDPEAAPVVQRMFKLRSEGASPTEIAKLLNGEGVPTPAQHKRATGSKRQLWNSERTDNFWRATTIGVILRDERYTGKLVALKTTL